ncbi:hypothetical protein [Psychrobacter sp. I-STPA6b]|uniref:hypothetical protein n=1 Tax=Psychrobacter sp. I-STPA6b TaxID=2585718 RepID=UPI001D0C55AB|nr:hypothetical protein [Psychrobacter sp. I-STPA6b]
MKVNIEIIQLKTDYEIEPFDWVQPENIDGYHPAMVRSYNIDSFGDGNITKCNKEEQADQIIADYYLECFYHDGDYHLLIEYGLWLIKSLYCSYVAYIYPCSIKEKLPKNETKINQLFDILYNEFEGACQIKEYHCAKLIRVFMFELLQYGAEWGMFLHKNNNINEAKEFDYLYAYLSEGNLAKLVDIEKFNKGNIPNYKY